ncbi:MAG TPA: DNA repair protein RecN [Burkholderiales bacterium]|nr:DNA repair protein RecN [Burkholderiales bacterium]
MLRSLSIRDFVIVERMELEFDSGFTVLTGETGAGKSILIDALALVLGARADALVVRQGAERAEVSAEFDIAVLKSVKKYIENQELTDEGGTCLVRRVIDAGGRSRAFINGTAVTATQLRELGELLVDIHGQHQHQSLARAPVQRELVDAYGKLEAQAEKVAVTYRDWRDKAERRRAFESNAAAYVAERERLEWQVNDLAQLDFKAEEWPELNAEHSRLSHAASLIEAAEFGMETLSEGEGATLVQVNSVIARLKHLVDYDPKLKEVLDVLEPAQVQLQEAVYSLRHYQQKLDLDPKRLRDAEQRLEVIHSAARKYRTEPEQLPEMLAKARARLDELSMAGDADTLRKLEVAAREVCVTEAKKLSAGRRKAAKQLAEKVTAAMQDLAMGGGVFDVALNALEEPAAHGLENIEFLVSAHKGMTPQPLAKVASGGELSRISLAIQTITSQIAQVPTLIFDEVDAGIGGRVAEIVGKLLKELGKKHQVMCITHLPQVAACGDQQWQVAKSASNGKVASKVTVLDKTQRVEEIARMLGGVKITETTRKHAAEMLVKK